MLTIGVAMLIVGAATDELPGVGILGGSVIGIMLLLGLFGWVWFKPAVDDLLRRLAKTETQRDSMITVYEEKALPFFKDQRDIVMPALTGIQQSLSELMAATIEVKGQLNELRSEVRELARKRRTTP